MIVQIRHQSGFTVLESLVALGIFSIAALAMANAFATNMSFNTLSDIRTGAIQAGQQILDDNRFSDPSSLPSSGASVNENVQIGNRTYNTTTTYCRNMSYCNSTNVRTVFVEVSYKGKEYYEVETAYTQLR